MKLYRFLIKESMRMLRVSREARNAPPTLHYRHHVSEPNHTLADEVREAMERQAFDLNMEIGNDRLYTALIRWDAYEALMWALPHIIDRRRTGEVPHIDKPTYQPWAPIGGVGDVAFVVMPDGAPLVTLLPGNVHGYARSAEQQWDYAMHRHYWDQQPAEPPGQPAEPAT